MRKHGLVFGLAGLAVFFTLAGAARADFPVPTNYRFQGFELDLLDAGVCAALGTTAVTDAWSLVLTSTGTYAGGSISFTAVLMTDP